MAALGSLVIQLAVDTARFQGDLGRAATIAESRMRNIKDTASRSLGAVAVAAAAAGAALVAGLKKGIDQADQLNDLSQAIGVTVENLSRLEFAGRQSGATLEQIGTGLRAFSSQVQDAAAGKSISATFQAIGVSVTDLQGKLRPTSEILSDVASRFASYADGASKTAIATDLFGRSGSALIPLLNQGAAGLEEMAKQSDALGFTLSTATAKGADVLKDRLGLVSLASDAFKRNLAAELLPTLNALIGPLLNAATAGDTLREAVRGAAASIKLFVSAGVLVAGVLKGLGNIIGAVAASLVALAQGEFTRAAEVMKAVFSDIVADGQSAATRLLDIWDEAGRQAVARAPTVSGNLAAPIIQAAEKAHKAAGDFEADFARTQEKFAADLQASTNRMFNENTRRWNKAADDAKKSISEMSIAADQAARNIQSVFADFLFDPFSDGLRGMLTGFINVIRRMVAEAAAAQILRALFGGGGGGAGGGLGGFLGGLLGGLFGGGVGNGGRTRGFQHGGSFAVGGAGGPDSQLVAFRATPGERVSVTPTSGAATSPIVNITTNIDARGATTELIKALPDVLRRNNEALEHRIVDGLRRGRYAV